MPNYTAYFDRSYDTIEGKFTIQGDDGNAVFKQIQARSGLQGFTDTSWETGRSPIPYGRFRLYTKAVPLKMSPGGDFFGIGNVSRNVIESLNGRKRRVAVGLHAENNNPGSAGCIVIVNRQEFKDIAEFLKTLYVEGIEDIFIQTL